MIAVVAIPPTVIVANKASGSDTAALDKQLNTVADVHNDVTHNASDSAVLTVCSPTPKLSPQTVTELPPLTAEFNSPYDTTAASKLKTGADVPATPPTLTADIPNIVIIELLTHTIVVADVHDDVPHATISRAAVAVTSPTPKSSPQTVTEPLPLLGLFCAMSEAIGASKL